MVFIIFTWPLPENHWRYYIFAQIFWVWCPTTIHTWALIIYSLLLHLFRMWYKPTISTACSKLTTVKYILLLTLTTLATPLLPYGSVLSIFSMEHQKHAQRQSWKDRGVAFYITLYEATILCLQHHIFRDWNYHHKESKESTCYYG